MQQRFRVFLSAVCGEFRRAREAVASDLRARGLEVKAQRDFRQEGTPTPPFASCTTTVELLWVDRMRGEAAVQRCIHHRPVRLSVEATFPLGRTPGREASFWPVIA